MPRNDPTRKRKPPKHSAARRKNETLNDLRTMHTQCQNLLKESASVFPFLKNEELCKQGDFDKIQSLSGILARDLNQMKSTLDDIKSRIPTDTDPEDLNAIFPLLNIGEEYQNWQTEYIAVIVPTVTQLNAELQRAAANQQGENNE